MSGGELFFNVDPDDVGSPDLQNQYLFANDPAVRLQEVTEPTTRHARQRQLLDHNRGKLGFSAAVSDWAYRKYSVQRLEPDAAEAAVDAPLGNAPAQPEDVTARRNRAAAPQTDGTGRLSVNVGPSSARTLVLSAAAQTTPPNLILFNVLVGLEWDPDADYLRQLEWAFRRASDFLYDVTDGRMAFGQVLFAGVALLDCADIQIMASNRFHPRSWVGGLHDPAKYLPIRLGRGVWYQRNQLAIPWDEPEAYRALVHEWGHYALGLKDEYLGRRPLVSALAAGLPQARPDLLVRATEAEEAGAPYAAAVQNDTSQASASIMANLVGTSEIVPHVGGSAGTNKAQEWDRIEALFAIKRPARTLEGPGRLPLPLPQFMHHTGGAGDQLSFPSQRWARALFDGVLRNALLERCRLYVVRGVDTGRPRLIAQGTLDARSAEDAFPLLGATLGDTVVLIADNRYRRPVAAGADYRTQHPAVRAGVVPPQGPLEGWGQAATPDPFPLVEVLPDRVDPDTALAELRVRIDGRGEPLPDQVWIFPLGLENGAVSLRPALARHGAVAGSIWTSGSQPVSTLDGHVLLRWTGEGRERLTIASFSQGGGPDSHGPFAPIPITAGSSDGDVMLFFYGEDDADTAGISKVKVITTIENGAQGAPPEDGARPWSYPFTLASNERLPTKFCPTLIVQFATPEERYLLTGDLLICRLEEGEGGPRWAPQPTYLPAGAAFAATPLANVDESAAVQPGGSLIAPGEPDAGRVERYQLWWVPRQPGAGAGRAQDEVARQEG